MMLPNLFISGFPKSGTTSLAQYLDDRDDAFVCFPKEPHFWTSEYDHRMFNGIQSLPDYCRLFSGVKPRHQVVCDASTSTIWSGDAVRRILKFIPDARFIVMIRNPIELCVALHQELLISGNETEKCFSAAWDLQTDRGRGRLIPKTAYCPEELQYAKVARVGSHLSRLFDLVSADRCHVIIFDDMKSSMRDVYLSVLTFLNLPDDGRQEFPVYNKSPAPRFSTIARFLRSPPWPLNCAAHYLRRLLWYAGIRGTRYMLTKRLCTTTAVRSQLPSDLHCRIVGEFRAEIALLEKLLDRDFSHWLLAKKLV